MTETLFTERLPDELPSDPMHWADAWIQEAHAAKFRRNSNSMTLVTIKGNGQPSARIVLCKSFVPDPGYLVFYTNFKSGKAREIEANPVVATVFHWDGPGRQIRIEGIAIQSPAAESDAYFATRDWGAQLGAWGSDQSAEIASREDLLTQIRLRAEELGIALGDDLQTLASSTVPEIPRPPHWGGIRIWANAIELWKDGADRIHDRALWKRTLMRTSEHEFATTPWVGTRLQP